jgi:hypothetical protein
VRLTDGTTIQTKELMDFKPSDFFINVIDFFAVILPGAVLTYFLKGLVYPHLFGAGKIFPELYTDVQKAIAFLIATYVVGNLIFPMGSLLLDDVIYDKFLRNTFFKKNFDLAYLTATAIREEHLNSEAEIDQLIATRKLNSEAAEQLAARPKREILNTFKWAQNYLGIKSPSGLTEVQKLEADSKFFRSLAVAFIIIGAVLLFKAVWIWAAVFLALSLLSIYRYGDLRYKSTQKAYELIVSIDHLEKCSPPTRDEQIRDNRAQFLASAETVRAYQHRINDLTKGMRVSTELLAIPRAQTWNVTQLEFAQTLLCLQGRSALINKTAARHETVLLSSGATLPVTRDSIFEVNNASREALVLLTVR